MLLYYHDDVERGICIKAYVDLKKCGDYTNEYRVFYANHEIVSISRNSGQASYTLEPLKELLETYRIIIEAGDGSVSGLLENQNMISNYRALYYCFSKVETI
ncbi:MAG: hypothetical protein UIM26_05935 [Longicatena sp.]|nr:hypothetical protein [Longicatena sp.]